MSTLRQASFVGVIAGALALTASYAFGLTAAKASGLAAADAAVSNSSTLPPFTPPPDSAIPDDQFGAMVRRGRDIFTNTQKYAKQYVGNGLNCENCHLDAGRRANSGPLWAAYVRYPRYLSKNDAVNTFAERLQGCFEYSMNGKPPPADSEIIAALTTYSYWLATGAPTGKDLAGFDYPKQGFASPEAPGYERGRKIYEKDCALCHGNDGQGQKVAGAYVFPPLWGAESFNWGAGMQELDIAAAFIKANMPLQSRRNPGRSGCLGRGVLHGRPRTPAGPAFHRQCRRNPQALPRQQVVAVRKGNQRPLARQRWCRVRAMKSEVDATQVSMRDA